VLSFVRNLTEGFLELGTSALAGPAKVDGGDGAPPGRTKSGYVDLIHRLAPGSHWQASGGPGRSDRCCRFPLGPEELQGVE
jgi:hypothetical protein